MTSALGVLPRPRGPLSEAILGSLGRGERGAFPEPAAAEPFGEDLQLALFVCYELHHNGFPGVDDDWEWDPDLLRLRAVMERVFLDELRGCTAGGGDVRRELAELLTEPIDGVGISQFLAASGEKWQLREYLVLRSAQHQRTADPLARPLPRSRGQRYARLMAAAGLASGVYSHLDHIPAPMLAVVNLRSLCGLHRGLRGAFAGHQAAEETIAKPESVLLNRALRRLGVPARGPVREPASWREAVDELLADEPALAGDVVFGIQAAASLEARLAARVLAAWHLGSSTLR
jgi:hypothetical protein